MLCYKSIPFYEGGAAADLNVAEIEKLMVLRWVTSYTGNNAIILTIIHILRSYILIYAFDFLLCQV